MTCPGCTEPAKQKLEKMKKFPPSIPPGQIQQTYWICRTKTSTKRTHLKIYTSSNRSLTRTINVSLNRKYQTTRILHSNRLIRTKSSTPSYMTLSAPKRVPVLRDGWFWHFKVMITDSLFEYYKIPHKSWSPIISRRRNFTLTTIPYWLEISAEEFTPQKP